MYFIIHIFYNFISYIFSYIMKYIFYYISYNPVLFCFVASYCHSFGHWELFDISLCFWHFIGVFCFLFLAIYSGTTRFARFLLYFSCLSPRISHFSKELWLLLLENCIWNQDQGTRTDCSWAAGMSLLLGSLGWQSKENIHVYISLCIHVIYK